MVWKDVCALYPNEGFRCFLVSQLNQQYDWVVVSDIVDCVSTTLEDFSPDSSAFHTKTPSGPHAFSNTLSGLDPRSVSDPSPPGRDWVVTVCLRTRERSPAKLASLRRQSWHFVEISHP